MANKTVTKTRRFPFGKDFDPKRGEAIHPLALVPELREAGLGDLEIRLAVDFEADDPMPDNDEEGVEAFPLFIVWVRRVGTRRWNRLGTTRSGYRFPPALVGRNAGEHLLRWLAQAEERCLHVAANRYLSACPS